MQRQLFGASRQRLFGASLQRLFGASLQRLFGASLQRLFGAIAVLLMTLNVFGFVQYMYATSASAAPTPPATCNADNVYLYSDPACQGNAGNPPAGCLNGNTVNTTRTDCLAWKAKVPVPAAPTGGGCAAGSVQGPLGVCCAPTDAACLAGSIQTAQGDPTSLALAKTVCNESAGPLGGPTKVPYACTLTTPTIEAAKAACNSAGQNFDSNQPFWADCLKLAVSSVGEAPSPNAPFPTDAATAKTICGLLKQNSGGSVKANQIPAACNGANPSPQDGVAACKLFETSGLAKNGDPNSALCFSLLLRDPINAAAQTAVLPPQHVNFNDTNIKHLAGGLSYFAIALCIGGMFFSMALWAIGSKGNNEGQQHTGKRGLLVCLLAAFLIGALPTTFSFFDNLARHVDNNNVTAAN